ncbi:glycosyltransferase involved in cell wall biosynthesis [Brevundimonas bullata]|uniref:Glycosyltransferase involved in cell wall biosynthesis n=1 Tax=Brevundimonas bullata TaxID=13160 RepID=A0A7W7IPR6_9CAUL|nr:glycosyltransferase involved in cell wall biosynthesis [Brevundimonas bullata]MBB6383417.1 glycosyltransferase involved in cell wall biosynthesis [Brevundimonas bullata]
MISHYRSLNDVREGGFHAAKAALGRFLANRISRSVVGVCNAAQAFAHAPNDKWVTLYNGIDLPHSNNNDCRRNDLVIGYLGRISPEKNPHRSLDILEAILRDDRGRNAKLRVAGGGTPDQLRVFAEDVKQRRLENSVEICGVTDQPIEFLRKCTVLLLPSHREGLPGAVLEALSVGTPVVANDLPGVQEIATAVEGVLTCPLSANNIEWAELVFDATKMARPNIAASFAQGPFLIHRHLQSVLALWEHSIASVAP